MRDRGNNEVAPTEWLLSEIKSGRMSWEIYADWYHGQLTSSAGQIWMEKRAEEARVGNILLVCYEKNSMHCHRRLLAEEIARRFNVEYKGELSWECHYFRAIVVNDICQKPKKDKICLSAALDLKRVETNLPTFSFFWGD